VKIGRRGRECRQIGYEPLLEAQGIAAVLVIAAHATAFAVAALAVAGNRGVVAHMRFKPHGATTARGRGRFRGRE